MKRFAEMTAYRRVVSRFWWLRYAPYALRVRLERAMSLRTWRYVP